MPDDFSIARASEGDAAALSRIGRSTFTDTFGHLYRREDLEMFLEDKHSPQAYARVLGDDRTAAWLVRDADEAIVGYAVAAPCDLPVPNMKPNAGELARLYLSKEAQGGGVGGRLLREALQWLTSNFDAVYLSVYAENPGAQRLYARHGFIKIHDYHYMVGNHADPEWIMELSRE